jgi:hypothetical protein
VERRLRAPRACSNRTLRLCIYNTYHGQPTLQPHPTDGSSNPTPATAHAGSHHDQACHGSAAATAAGPPGSDGPSWTLVVKGCLLPGPGDGEGDGGEGALDLCHAIERADIHFDSDSDPPPAPAVWAMPAGGTAASGLAVRRGGAGECTARIRLHPRGACGCAVCADGGGGDTDLWRLGCGELARALGFDVGTRAGLQAAFWRYVTDHGLDEEPSGGGGGGGGGGPLWIRLDETLRRALGGGEDERLPAAEAGGRLRALALPPGPVELTHRVWLGGGAGGGGHSPTAAWEVALPADGPGAARMRDFVCGPPTAGSDGGSGSGGLAALGERCAELDAEAGRLLAAAAESGRRHGLFAALAGAGPGGPASALRRAAAAAAAELDALTGAGAGAPLGGGHIAVVGDAARRGRTWMEPWVEEATLRYAAYIIFIHVYCFNIYYSYIYIYIYIYIVLICIIFV